MDLIGEFVSKLMMEDACSSCVPGAQPTLPVAEALSAECRFPPVLGFFHSGSTLPGFMMLSGSRLAFSVRITSTAASPCSLRRNFALP
jgi:hypothetical protein